MVLAGDLVTAGTTLVIPALSFLLALEESAEWALLSSFCDDSNLHIPIIKQVLSTRKISKESNGKFLIENLFQMKLRTVSPKTLFK